MLSSFDMKNSADDCAAQPVACSASPANGAHAAPFARGRATQNETWLLPLYCAYFPKTCRYFASCDRRASVWWVLVQF